MVVVVVVVVVVVAAAAAAAAAAVDRLGGSMLPSKRGVGAGRRRSR